MTTKEGTWHGDTMAIKSLLPHPLTFIYSQDYINSGDIMAKVKRVCEICNKEFEAHLSNIKRGRARFCSNQCKRAYYSNLFRKREKRLCKWCGKAFEEKPARVKIGKGIFCSKECYTKWQKRDKVTLNRLIEIRQGIAKPTKPERIFEEICKRNDLDFHYVGDGQLWIGKRKKLNPDFIEANGKKICVEIMGLYWHSPLFNRNLREGATLEYRKRHYRRYKWQPIFIWDTDLLRKDAEDFVLSVFKTEDI